MMRTLLALTLATLTLTAVTLPVLADNHASTEMAQAVEKDIVAVATEAGDFTTLTAALEAADLVETLQGDGPFTVFAPTDEAFAALPEGTLEDLLKPENKDVLVNILTYHVVPGAVMSTDLESGDVGTVLEDATVEITVSDDGVMVNDANVVTADIEASNGVIHVIDKVILPPDA
ncbi:MAG: fasciclin domain-containing protein [Synechococcaceae cyanobacterium SM2_3_1]|nr:fasciclin domain-containing protein [Synechococcaceae cyanobacterium SM2_3_1]